MAVGLVPYVWGSVGGIDCWSLPSGVVSAIDLRRFDQIADHASVGYAIAIYPGDLPEGSIPLDTGNVTRDRDAWFSTLGFRPEGEDAIDWAWDQLSEGRGADDSHADHCRPIRCATPEFVEMWLGGRNVRSLSYTDKLRQAVLSRRDLDAIFGDVVAGKLPEDAHRKMLLAEARRLGIDWQTLRPKTARWRSETPVEPATTIIDDFASGSEVALNTYNGWAHTPAIGAWVTGGGYLYCPDGGGWANSSNWAYPSESLSLSNNQCDLINTSNDSFGMIAAICRGSSNLYNSYGVDNWNNGCRLIRFVSGNLTSLNSLSETAGTLRLRVQAIGSTIKGSDTLSSWRHSLTDTTVTTGLKVGVFYVNLWSGAENRRQVDSFYARDFLTPASISTSPSSGSTAGGTSVTITGTGFESNATVSIGGNAATGVTVASETSLTATTPAGTAGAKNVVVTNPDSGFSGTQTNGFTYSAPTTTTTVATTTTTVPTTTTTAATTTTTAAGSGGPRTTLGSRRFGSHRGLSGN